MTLDPLERAFGYDSESYPNVYTIGIVNIRSGVRWIFEISDRVHQGAQLVSLLLQLRDAGCRMVGFNNNAYDYPILHFIIERNGDVTAAEINEKSNAIIHADRNDWSHSVWESDQIVPQVDLFKIMHFDNAARSTSLKKLEVAMRSANVEDLPFKPGTVLTSEQIDQLIDYMCWDIHNTVVFADTVADRIAFRDQLSEKYSRNFTNYNDTKIGKQIFINSLESAGVQCFTREHGRRMPRQTPRYDGIALANVMCPVPFESNELRRMWWHLHDTVVPFDQIKGFFTNLTATVHGLVMHFGSGGIHGSVSSRSFYADDTHEILDVDVTSYYPSLAIVNRFYPEHLTETFCDVYADLKRQRVAYPKGSPENAALKLSLNGVYGDSGNKHGPFLDPAYLLAITVNGQMQLAWLAERLGAVPGVELIQVNTDGVTIYAPRYARDQITDVCADWERSTSLDLEYVNYRSMHIRDVNNYVAIDTNGKVKRKNAYLIDPDFHQDHSSLVVPKAVDVFLRHGTPVQDFIYDHTDAFDFMRAVKVPRSSRLEWGDDVIQNVTRYHIALAGKPLTKVMPPLKGNTNERRIGIDVGWSVQVCNDASRFDWSNLNRRWYVIEAEKLVRGVGL